MVPDGPDVDHPAHPIQTVALFTFAALVLFLAVWGGIDLAWRVTNAVTG